MGAKTLLAGHRVVVGVQRQFVAFFRKAMAIIQGVVLLPILALVEHVVPFLVFGEAVFAVKRLLLAADGEFFGGEVAAHRKQVVLTDAVVEAQPGIVGHGGKKSAFNGEHLGSVPRLGRFPGEGKGYPH